MGDESQRSRWLVYLIGSRGDIAAVKQCFPSGRFTIEEDGDSRYLFAPEFDHCDSDGEVRAKAEEIIETVNLAMRCTLGHYRQLTIGGIGERTAKGLSQSITLHRRVAIALSTSVIAVVTRSDGRKRSIGPPSRSYQARLRDLIERDDRVREAASALAAKPPGWGDLNAVYETIKGKMSPRDDRGDWEALVKLGWVSERDSNRFRDTAGYYRHGHPRKPIRRLPEMTPDEGNAFVKGLFRRMVDHLQPN